ncbi:MAG: Na/Pi cotransporter family protein [Lachnospiraceae bacterium]|jgi:phosphate:Na+ symporter|nr:Na/Pi cotransporter family protein [Lachnospiraceae bacterium]
MTFDDLGLLFKFIGGLGLFLYGMHIMADGLQKSAGDRVKSWMGFLTKNRFVAVLIGAAITAIIQSSSATTVMVVGFVNAGLLTLTQAVGVIMGANIGTTITAWIVSLSEWGSIFSPDFFAPLIVGIGAFFILFGEQEKKKKTGEIMTGFGILFIGLSFMSGAVKPYRDAEIFADVFRVLGKNPLLAVIAGAVVTAVIQSSSASVGILQTLAMNGVVNWQSAVFIMLGQNIGTCVTAIISSTGAGKNAKRASMIHLLFNLIGSIWFGIIMFLFFQSQREMAVSTISSVEISVFHTIFNIANTFIMFPFANGLVRITELMISEDKTGKVVEDDMVEQMKRKLDYRILNNPALAIEAAVGEIVYMGILTRDNFKRAVAAVRDKDKEQIRQVFRIEENINQMVTILTAFLVEVDNLSLTEAQHLMIRNLFYTISDVERIGDHSENIAELANTKRKDKIEFSDKGEKDMERMYDITLHTFEAALEARELRSIEAARRASRAEEKVDKLEKDLRDKHIQRLSKGKCVPESGIIFLDILSNMERIADHADNIAEYVMAEV